MEAYLGRTHDSIGAIVHDRLEESLAAPGIDPSELCAVVKGSHPLSGIIHGDLDVDRMDYLLRDAYYTGAPYGTVDAQRLIRHLVRTDDGTVLDENGINAAESLLIARTLMRPSVYYHHVSRIGESMFQLAAIEHLQAHGAGSAEAFLDLDDAGALQTLASSQSEVARGIARRLYERRLYKRAIYAGCDQVNMASWEGGVPIGTLRRYAERIAEAAGIPPGDVLVDIPSMPGELSLGVRVLNRHEIVGLGEISSRIGTLNETRREQWRLGVYTLPEHREIVAEAGSNILNIKKPTRQDTLF
jgi:HD superfamily phosphohydrolase